MRIVLFCHSLQSDWNHGNAHFLRGVCAEILARGHDLIVYEPADSWSLQNLLSEFGDLPLSEFATAYPQLNSTTYDPEAPEVNEKLRNADLVLVHEWNDPRLVAQIGKHHATHGSYILLFHDTHHRSITDPDSMALYELKHFDGVLAFGDSISEVYRRRKWAE